MEDSAAPVLVYNRIDVNRRNTRLLIAAFAALLFPSAFGIAQFVPIAYGVARVVIFSLLLPGTVVFPPGAGVEAIPWTWLALLSFGLAVAIPLAATHAISSFLLGRAHARRAHRERDPELFRTVENLCIAAGLRPPTLYIVESAEPNAFAIAADSEHGSLVVNRGLLHLLDHRELAGVIAHELSHIGNHDTDLSTTLATLVATVRFPLNVVRVLAGGVSWLLQDPEDIVIVA